MKSEKWQRIKQLVHDAAELPGDQQHAYVMDQAKGDTTLALHVLSLLSEETTQTKTRSGSPLRSLFEKSDGSEYEGMEIGPYTVEQELGRGGMGVVLLARDTENDNRPVAVKILRRGLEGRDTVLRFGHERMILSELDHPNIASLLDGGTTHEGLHYLVMEYVKGEPIDLYCDRNRLDTRERLKLFLKICDAMAYAHDRQVVHRDLKPGNILVQANREPVILDFGIAKMNNPESLAHAPITATGQWLMTPEYAAPEQVRGEKVTPACDIYAMGVVLYELLTGHRPYLIESVGPLELARVICDEEPTKPSKVLDRVTSRPDTDGIFQTTHAETISQLRRTVPELLRKSLRGDLDRILMAALSKDAGDRYCDGRAMGDDIRNHLEGRSIDAKRRPLLERAGKWLSLNKPILQTSYALLLVFAGFSAARITAGTHDVQAPIAAKTPNARQLISRVASSYPFNQEFSVTSMGAHQRESSASGK